MGNTYIPVVWPSHPSTKSINISPQNFLTLFKIKMEYHLFSLFWALWGIHINQMGPLFGHPVGPQKVSRFPAKHIFLKKMLKFDFECVFFFSGQYGEYLYPVVWPARKPTKSIQFSKKKIDIVLNLNFTILGPYEEYLYPRVWPACRSTKSIQIF